MGGLKEDSKYVYSKQNNKLVLKISTLIAAILLFILVLPSGVFSLGTLYESLTPAAIDYNWLDYRFGVLQLLIAILGIFEFLFQRQIVAAIIFLIALAREILLFFIYDNSIFTDSAYEVYLTIFVGYGLFLITRRYMNNFYSMDKFYGWFLITNMLTIYINVAMGGRGTTSTGAELAHEGRYHASNLDVGGTGALCLLCIIYLYFSPIKKKYRYPLLVLSFIGLILSGSRADIGFAVAIIGYYCLKKIIVILKGQKIKISISMIYKAEIAVLSIILFSMWAITDMSQFLNRIGFERFEILISMAAFSSDGSVLGRFTSIQDGLDIITSNPIGISGYFINLQTEMMFRGFPTFPHSSLISGYILLGPIVLLLYIIWVRFLIKNRDYSNKYFWIILYYTISTVIVGGVIVNFKIIFTLVITTALAYKSLNDQKLEKT